VRQLDRQGNPDHHGQPASQLPKFICFSIKTLFYVSSRWFFSEHLNAKNHYTLDGN